MNVMRTPVKAQLQLRYVAPDTTTVPCPAELRFDPADPWAVTLEFRPETGAVPWLFARELLTDGVHDVVGEGDVQVWPSESSGGPVVCIALRSQDGNALFEASRADVEAFLSRSYAVLPHGAERHAVDIDVELQRILAEDS